jgi:hypothetical protein
MRRRKDPTLEDREIPVLKSEIDSLKRKLSKRYEIQADRILGARKPLDLTSVPATSGGQFESNRRKF